MTWCYQDSRHEQHVRREDTAKKLILLVEDDEDNAFLLIQVIEQEIGYQVAHMADGKTAWKFLQHVTPQLVILDYRLPDLDGLQLYDCMCSNTRLHDVPVLLVSAVFPTPEAEHGKIVSLDKPFDLDNLIQTIETLLSS
jgi:DNA-binding response OmpR family regulator